MLVAIGDLHGHYPALERILGALRDHLGVFTRSGADRLRTDTKLVFTGDYIDRGHHALAIIERLKSLAERNPGRVVTLLGNHELMALEAYDDVVAIWRRSQASSSRRALGDYQKTRHDFNGGTEFVREFGTSGTRALASYVERMAPTGDVGAWMRALLPAYKARVAGRTVLCMHADLPTRLRDSRVLESDVRFIEGRRLQASPALGGTRAKWGHPRLFEFFWSRSFEHLERASRADVEALCGKVGVDFIVTGHTSHAAITVYGGRIFDIDVGMTPICGGRTPQALVFDSAGIHSIDAEGRERSFVRFDG